MRQEPSLVEREQIRRGEEILVTSYRTAVTVKTLCFYLALYMDLLAMHIAGHLEESQFTKLYPFSKCCHILFYSIKNHHSWEKKKKTPI